MIIRTWCFVLALFGAMMGPAAFAQDQITPAGKQSSEKASKLIPTEHLAGRSALRRFEMAPDGTQFAALRVEDKDKAIQIFDAATLDQTQQWEFGERQKVDWFRWLGSDRILVSASTEAYRFGARRQFGRLYIRELGSGETYELPLKDRGWLLDDLVHLAEDGSYALLSVYELPEQYPSVYRFDLKRNSEPRRIVAPKKGVWWWHADDAGVVRLGMGWLKKRLRVYYRPDGESDFDLIGKLRPGDDDARFWNVVQIVSGSDTGYVLEEGANGRVGIRLFDYSKAQILETFYEHPLWDVESMWLDDEGQPLAAFYTEDREQVVWFDEEYEALYQQMRRSLGEVDLRFISRSEDDARMLFWAGHEADPGVMYIHTKGDALPTKFADLRPELDRTALIKPKPVRYTARDGLEIPAYLTLPEAQNASGLPLIILPHGGPFGVRDKLEYNDEVQFLANRGYAVLQPNFRGSGGFGTAFADAGRGQIGRKMQDDLDDAMDWAVREGIADPDRVCVVGGSYGGYAALWAVLRNPERYRCAASWAGVTDLKAILKYDRRFLSRKASRKWREKVEGEGRFDVRDVSPISRAEDLNRPVLLAHGMNDYTVPFDQYRAFEAESNNAPVRIAKLPLSDEGHGFSSAKNEQKWYDALERFLREHNPAD